MKIKIITNDPFEIAEEYNQAYKSGYTPCIHLGTQLELPKRIQFLSRELQYRDKTKLNLGAFYTKTGEFKLHKFTVHR